MRYFITGTDTDVGKTVAAAWTMLHLEATYWKPVQAGIEEETDEAQIRRITGAGDDRIHDSAYVLPDPLSPHEAAKRAGVTIDMAAFALPDADGPLVVEGAGGLMVPLNQTSYMIDLIEMFGLPAILVARSSLGTINHTLLSLGALRARRIPVAGVVLNGQPSPHNREAIETYGAVRVLAEIPPLDPLCRETLLAIKPECDLTKATVPA
jgi:dethiobiotin synthase